MMVKPPTLMRSRSSPASRHTSQVVATWTAICVAWARLTISFIGSAKGHRMCRPPGLGGGDRRGWFA